MSPEVLQPITEPEITKIIYYVLYFFIFALVNVGIFWAREWWKHKTWNKNGTALDEIKAGQADIKTDMKEVSEKLGRVKTAVATIKTQQKAQTETCKSTVTRFDQERRDQNKIILDLAKGKK